jgi:UDP-glucose 4-epimerase
MSNKICLVTGGLGFIGSHLVDLLISKGHKVTVVDNLSTGNRSYANLKALYEFFDIGDEAKLSNLIKKLQPNWVFHLAALPRIQPSFEDPILHDEHNVRNSIKLITLLAKYSQVEAFVNSSSSSVYGNPLITPTPETDHIDPLSPYALQKFSSEYYVKILCKELKIPAISLRYFNPYGPRSFNNNNPLNAYSSVVGIFLNRAKMGQPLIIFGDGEQSRDFIHVNDVAFANYYVARNIHESEYNVFNVGFGKTFKVLDIAKKISHNIIFQKERHGEARITWADTSKLNAIGWRPTITVFDFIEKEMNSYKSYLHNE